MRVGIDVSKERLDVAMSDGRREAVDNTREGIADFVRRMSHESVKLVAMEASGGYERDVLYALLAAQIPTARVNARNVRDFAKALGRLAKTDKIDAEVLCLFAEKVAPPVRETPTEAQRELHELVLRRAQLVEMRTAESNRLHRLQTKAARRSAEAHIKWLTRQIESSDDDIDNELKKHTELLVKVEMLETVPGVARVTATSLLALLPELGHADSKQLAALVGLAPYNNDSGQHRGERHCWGGRSRVRAALYLSTMAAIRFNPTIKAKYVELRARDKKPKVAIIACARKLLGILNAMLHANQPWHPPVSATA